MASPDDNYKHVEDSLYGPVINTRVVLEEEWKGFSCKVQFSSYENYQKFLRLAKSCRPKALRSCFSSRVASKRVLHEACKQGASDVVRVLLSFEEVDVNNVDHDKKTALHHAASEGYENIVNLLLGKEKILANLQDSEGNTPLHCAAKKGYASIVEELVKKLVVTAVDFTNNEHETSLHLGAFGGHAETVKLLLEVADPTVKDAAGNTPLHLAASCGHEDVVKMLLEVRKVDVNAANSPYLNTPLHLASRREHENVVDLLLKHSKVRTDVKNEYGKTPLYYAADTANEPILKKLLETMRVESVDLNILHLGGVAGDLGGFYSNLLSKDTTDLNGRSKRQGETRLEVAALHLAAKSGMGAIVEMLLNNQSVDVNDVDDYKQTALHFATCGGHLDVVKILLEKESEGASWKDFEGNTPLHEAARIGHEGILERFLATSGVDANVANMIKETPMHLGAIGGHVGVVKLLLTHSADPSSLDWDGNSPLHVAAQNGHERIVEMLLESPHVEVNCINSVNMKTPLHLCVEESHENVVDFLLKNRNVNATLVDAHGESLLHKAACKGDEGIFKKILRAQGVDVNATNERHDTTLHVATRGGHEDIVDILLREDKLDASRRNRHGNTALHIAARKGNRAIFEKILNLGGHVNTKGKGGVIALHIAAKKGHREIVIEILKNQNVDASIHDDEGFSPLLRAAMEGHHHIVHLLLSHGVDVNDKRGRIGKTALAYAASFGHSKVVHILSEASNVDPNIGSTPPLICAAEGGHLRVFKRLLEFEEIDVCSTDSDGYTALHHLVVKDKSKKAVQRLLQRQDGIDVNSQTQDGQTALHLALSKTVSQESSEVVKILLETPGINLNIKNKKGESILFPAAERDSKSILMDIYKASKVNTGCVKDAASGKTLDLNAENHEGDSILHLATRKSYLNVIEFLLEVEHDSVNSVNMIKETSPRKDATNDGTQKGDLTGKTALDIAIEAKNYAVLELLAKFKSISFIAEDKKGRPTYLQNAFDKQTEDPAMFQFLQRNLEVKCYIDAVYKDRQASVDAANAILVGAALIASVTFASWLQPPLGYATDYHEPLEETFPAPPTYPQYAAFDHHPILRMFWVCNSLSFFFAIATVISGARSILPAQPLFIKQEVLNLRRNLLITSILLGLSMIFVLLAFAMAGITVLPPVLRFRVNMYSTIGIGGSVCTVLLGLLVKNICELLYSEVKNSRIRKTLDQVC